jgi:hypothetical protein
VNQYSTGTTEVAIAADVRGPIRRRLAPGWHFTRHLGEMVIAMFAGMGLLGLAIGALGEPPGYANSLVKYGLMGAAMALPMVGWMRFRGHRWGDGLEMTAAMVLPMLAVALPSALGLAGPTGHSLMMLAHVAMFAGMVILMLFRWDRYAHGAGHHRA